MCVPVAAGEGVEAIGVDHDSVQAGEGIVAEQLADEGGRGRRAAQSAANDQGVITAEWRAECRDGAGVEGTGRIAVG